MSITALLLTAMIAQAPSGTTTATVSTRAMLETIGTAVGQEVKPRTAGKTMLSVLGLFNPTLREFKEMYYEFAEPYVVDDSKFRQAFGGSFTPLEQGISATVDWYRSRLN